MSESSAFTPMWQQLGLDRERSVEYITNRLNSIAKFSTELSQSTTIVSRLFGLTERTEIAVFKHLGFSDPRCDLGVARALALECCDHGVDFFLGTWRDGFTDWEVPVDDPTCPVDSSKPWIKRGRLTVAECRKQLSWLDPLRYGLMWSLLFDRADAVEKIASWPDEDLLLDEGLLDRTQQDCWFFILLCQVIRGQEEKLDGHLAAKIEAGRPKRPKLFLEIFRAIMRKDSDGFADSMTRWLRHFKKTEFRTIPIDETITLEGTLLWHLARRQKIRLPQLPKALSPLILTPSITPLYTTPG